MLTRPLSFLVGLGFILLGMASGYIFGQSYSGKFLIDYLASPGKHRLLKNEVIAPPNIAFNYQHNLAKFPEEIFKYGNEASLLRIIGGRIDSVPAQISSLGGLTVLEISDNKLASIPEELGSLTSLTYLNLGGNALTSLPQTIGALANLKRLSLYDNKLTSLPPEIGSLSSLETLDLHRNSLSSLPDTIVNLTNLKLLYLGGNQLGSEEKDRIQKLLPNSLIFF